MNERSPRITGGPITNIADDQDIKRGAQLRAAALLRAHLEYPDVQRRVAELHDARRCFFLVRRRCGIDIERVARAVAAVDRVMAA